MPALVLILSTAVAALILSIKTAIGTPDPNSKTNWPLVYLIISLVASVVGALAFVNANPTIFAGDPLFANNPWLGALAAALVSVLPGGVGTSLLTLMYLKAAPPNTLSGQAALTDEKKIRRGLVLWG